MPTPRDETLTDLQFVEDLLTELMNHQRDQTPDVTLHSIYGGIDAFNKNRTDILDRIRSCIENIEESSWA